MNDNEFEIELAELSLLAEQVTETLTPQDLRLIPNWLIESWCAEIDGLAVQGGIGW